VIQLVFGRFPTDFFFT